jgi:hypothetical protein
MSALMSNYPNGFANGVSIRGVPLLSAYPGEVFWVDSNNGSNSNSGNFNSPFASIDYAVGRCLANRGDVIMVKAGHAEVVSAAGGLDLDVAGITIVGLGAGALMPTVTLTTAATADVDVDAANITVMNINFVAGFADITAAIDVNATDFSLIGCRFTQSAVDLNALIWVQDAAAAGSDRITIQDCHVIAYDAANTHFVNFAGTGDGHIVTGNTLIGDWGTMAIGGAGVITRCTITHNSISNAATTNDAAINLAATATGIVMHNYACGGAAQANGFTATGCAKAQNYYGVLAEDASAILDPIAT